MRALFRVTPILLCRMMTYEWVAGENLGDYVRPAMVRRLQEALKALETGEVLEISSDD